MNKNLLVIIAICGCLIIGGVGGFAIGKNTNDNNQSDGNRPVTEKDALADYNAQISYSSGTSFNIYITFDAEDDGVLFVYYGDFLVRTLSCEKGLAKRTMNSFNTVTVPEPSNLSFFYKKNIVSEDIKYTVSYKKTDGNYWTGTINITSGAIKGESYSIHYKVNGTSEVETRTYNTTFPMSVTAYSTGSNPLVIEYISLYNVQYYPTK